MSPSYHSLAEILAASHLSGESQHADTGIEAVIRELAKLVTQRPPHTASSDSAGSDQTERQASFSQLLPSTEARYRVLVEHIPAVVFMAIIDGGISEVYVSPHIEQMLGFPPEEWLDDPMRWYQQIHPQDRNRWSIETAQLFLTGEPLKSVYRVISRDGRVIWFHCEAKLVRRDDGRPWFIHGVGFDITEPKEAEQALQQKIAEIQRLQKLEFGTSDSSNRAIRI